MTQRSPMHGMELATVLTISTAHLHPATIAFLEQQKGDLPEGPSVAVREEGFLVNSHLGNPEALASDFTAGLFAPLAERMPDLVLIRALARGCAAEWVNIDRDGVEYTDILPTYDDHGNIETTPSSEGWSSALSSEGLSTLKDRMIVVPREVLEIIEAGQTPGLQADSPEM